jgi:hypothetical protein
MTVLVDELLASNPQFRAMVAKSKASPRKPISHPRGKQTVGEYTHPT